MISSVPRSEGPGDSPSAGTRQGAQNADIGTPAPLTDHLPGGLPDAGASGDSGGADPSGIVEFAAPWVEFPEA